MSRRALIRAIRDRVILGLGGFKPMYGPAQLGMVSVDPVRDAVVSQLQKLGAVDEELPPPVDWAEGLTPEELDAAMAVKEGLKPPASPVWVERDPQDPTNLLITVKAHDPRLVDYVTI